jgi:hypothetical protein
LFDQRELLHWHGVLGAALALSAPHGGPHVTYGDEQVANRDIGFGTPRQETVLE